MKLMQLIPPEPDVNTLPIVQHKCEVINIDIVKTLIPGDKLINRLKRWIVRRFILSRKHPIIKFCIKSNASVNKDIIKHIQLHHYMIHPFSEFRKLWEILMTIFTLFSLITIPYFITFQFNYPHKWMLTVLVVKLIFIIDIILFSITGYYDYESRNVVFHRKKVCQKYMKNFVFDLLSAFPYEIIFIIFPTLNNDNSMAYWSILDILMILRLKNLVFHLRILRKLYQVSLPVYKIIEMLVIIFIIIHWATCMELFIALIGEKYQWARRPNQISWINSKSMKTKNSKVKMYAHSFRRSITALLARSHRLDVKTREDVLLNLFLTLLGRAGIIYMLAQVWQLMTMFRSIKINDTKSQHELLEYMRYKKLPPDIQKNVSTYFNYRTKKSSMRDKMIISSVSPNLREELLMHKYSGLLKNVKFFKYLPQDAISRIIKILKIEIYLTNDVLVEANSICDTMVYLNHGTVVVYIASGKTVCILEKGTYFGEVGLIIENEKRLVTVTAKETCEAFLLKRDNFLKVIDSYPYLMNRLQKLVIGTFGRSSLHETLHKFDDSKLINVNVYDETTVIEDIN